MRTKSNRETVVLSGFTGLYTSLGGVTPPGYASDLLNVRLADGKIRPRFGYKTITSRPAGFESALGLIHLSGYDDAYQNREEFVSIERRFGTVRPYSIHPLTGSRMPISAAALEPVDHTGFSFGGEGYIVAPGASKSLYKHSIGDLSSWKTLQDTAYTAPAKDAELTISANSAVSYGWNLSGTSPDSVTSALLGPYGLVSVSGLASASGVVEVNGNNFNRGGQHRTRVTGSFGTAQDWSKHDYGVFYVTAGVAYPNFERTGIAPRIRTNGTFKTLPYQEYFSPSSTQVAILVRLKGIADLNLVERIEFAIGGSVEDPLGPPVVVFNLQKVILGGTYLEASAAGGRLWDGNLDGDGITYGVRYKNGATYSTLKTQTIERVQTQGTVIPAFSGAIGGRIILSTPASGGSESDVQFLRLMQDGSTWKVLGTVANSGSPQWLDQKEEHELAALSTAMDTGSVTVTPPPTFKTTGLKGGFAYKGWVIWLFRGGKSNVRHSRVGNAEELFSTDAVYESDDLTQPADFTLADNFGDEPVGGVQAGEAAIILGTKAAYSQNGNAPGQMSPCRQVPGSNGVAGTYAFARFKPRDGQYGCAYVDALGNVWFIGQQAAFAGDTQSRPYELSEPIRGYVWSFLVEGQKAEFGYLDLAKVQVQVDEATGSLWIVLGRRGLVLRPGDSVGNSAHWEAYEYAVQAPALSTSTTVCTDPAFGIEPASSVARSGSNVAWTAPNAVFLSDDVSAAASLGPSKKSELLRAGSLPPSPSLPTDATLVRTRVLVEHSKSGETWVDVDEAYFTLSGARVGSNLAVAGDIPSSDTAASFEVLGTAGLFTVEDLNAARVGFELGHTADPASVSKYDAANWSLSVSPSGVQSVQGAGTRSLTTDYVVTATYVGTGAAPKSVVILVSGAVTASYRSLSTPPVIGYSGTATATAFDSVDSGPIGSVSVDGIPPADRRATGSKRIRVVLAGGSGTATFSLSGSSKVAPFSGSDNIAFVSTQVDSFAVVQPAPGVVRVDSLALSACYRSSVNEPLITNGIGLERLAFSPRRQLYGLTGGGEVVALEWDPVMKKSLAGVGRDGSLLMPLARWTSGEILGRMRRLSSVRSLGERAGIGAKSERTEGFVSGTANANWTRFGVSQSGLRHQVQVELDESCESVDQLVIEFTRLSDQRQR